jgi:hypothetical protein
VLDAVLGADDHAKFGLERCSPAIGNAYGATFAHADNLV